MKTLCTLVASSAAAPVTVEHLQQVACIMAEPPPEVCWLKEGKAADLQLRQAPSPVQRQQIEDCLAAHRIDLFLQPAAASRQKRLLVADMDNTLIVGETLDDLAAHYGLKEQIATITAQAMRGEVDFQGALKQRVALMAGREAAALEVTAAAIKLMPGARQLAQGMQRQGAVCAIVSGGFSYFTSRVAARLAITHHFANSLLLADGRLTGEVAEPILDQQAKAEHLLALCRKLGLQPEQCLAVGDGANDLAMLKAAGLGVGFHPKPVLRRQVSNSILYGDLTALLYAQGYSEVD